MADETHRQRQAEELWTSRDRWLGALFLLTGCLVTAYTCMAMRNGMPAMLWAVGWVVGPLLLLLGGHALWRPLRTKRAERRV